MAQTLAATIADYEQRAGKVLQPAHIERLLINTFAYREHLLRQQVNEAYRQQHPRFATGLMLDLRGGVVLTVLRASLSSDSLHQPFLPSPAGEADFTTADTRSCKKMKHRCKNCNKLLAIGTGKFEIRCPRCKAVNQFGSLTTRSACERQTSRSKHHGQHQSRQSA